MDILHFTDERIEEVYDGEALTVEERQFLVDDTYTFEECSFSKRELSAMTDIELMSTCYGIWAEYAKDQQ